MLKKILEFLFSKYFAQSWKQGYLQAQADDRCERIRGRSIETQQRVSKLLGQKVIFLPNEWQNPVFGFVVQPYVTEESTLSDSEVLVKDVLTGVTAPYSVQSLYLADTRLVLAVLKLDPLERYNLSAGRVHLTNMWKTPPLEYLAPNTVELYQRLKQVNFVEED